jgi:hypothetical protein
MAEYGEEAVHQAFLALVEELDRQIRLKDAGKFKHLCSEMRPMEALSCLVEEVGEVARALNDNSPDSHLEEELIQTASVCLSWVMGLRNREGGPMLIGDAHSGKPPKKALPTYKSPDILDPKNDIVPPESW